jgi:hypothetical protein
LLVADNADLGPSSRATPTGSPRPSAGAGPTHGYHQAPLSEIESQRHARLGDAMLAAQSAYAEAGPCWLIAICHLFCDPALRIR